jgi:hypothetical protein
MSNVSDEVFALRESSVITTRDAALLSYLAYNPPRENAIALPGSTHWSKQIQLDAFDDTTSGFSCRVFRNPADEYVVAFRRSAPFAWSEPDWLWTNVDFAVGAHNVQLDEALLVIAYMQSTGIALSQISFAGHSLGGG